jgi:hypothetical protein
MKLILKKSLLCYAILASQGSEEEKIKLFYDVLILFHSNAPKKFVSKAVV